MKIIFIFYSLIIFLTSTVSNAQTDFKIKTFDHNWTKANRYSVDLIINLSVKNTGTETEVCEDIKKLRLVSPLYWEIEIGKLNNISENISKVLNPGDSVFGSVSFTVPVSEDSLFLTIKDNTDSRKFIAKSYNYYICQKNILEAEKLDSLGESYNALLKYQSSFSLISEMDSVITDKIYKLNIKLGDKAVENKNYIKAIEYYRSVIDYNSNDSVSRNKLSIIYDVFGDHKANSSSLSDAIAMYDYSLKYAKSEIVEKKKRVLKEKIESEKLFNPRFGTTFGINIGSAVTDEGKGSLPLLSLVLRAPIKLFMEKNSGICLFLNSCLGYDFIVPFSNDSTHTSSNAFNGFTNFDKNKYTMLRTPDYIGNFYCYGGLGIALINKHLMPMISVNYGFTNQNFVKFKTLNNFTGDIIDGAAATGYGLFIESNIKFSRNSNFSMGYTFSRISVNGGYDFNQYTMTTHSISLLFSDF
ncbi:hypothetical protein BH10BAC5_BH10BAC5_25530 [soil metagenome]